MKSLFALLALLLSASACAQVYKCVNDGRTIYSQTSCGADAQPILAQPPTDTAAPSQNGGNEATKMERDALERSNAKIQRRILKEKINLKKNELKGLEQEMDGKLAQLHGKMNSVPNTPANADWIKSVSEQMKTLIAAYNIRNEKIWQEINRLEKEMDALPDAIGSLPADENNNARKWLEESNATTQKRILEDKIQLKKNELKGLEQEVDKRLVQLQNKMNSAPQTPANAKWVESVNEEMQALISLYDTRVKKVGKEIDSLEAEQEKLGN